jgi:BirA family biotin operon repressor/biotin-[acetyl-CoA-carboxylase] ligase
METVSAELAGELSAALATLEQRAHGLRQSEHLVLDCAAVHFDPGAFAAARRGVLGDPLHVYESAPSTNDLARAAAGSEPHAVWLAESQTAGRGRQGRRWECAAHAGLLVSFVLEASLEPDALPTLLPLAVGLGAAEALREATSRPVCTKWPNDLWLEGGKLGGVLLESLDEARVVVGLGLNVRKSATTRLEVRRAVSLEDAGAVARREVLLAVLLAGIERTVDAWRERRFEALLSAYCEHESTIGRTVQAQVGGEVIRGSVRGVTAEGLLRVEVDGGSERTLVGGEVHLL